MCQTICKSKRPSINLPKWIKSSAKTFFILEHITRMQIPLEISSYSSSKRKVDKMKFIEYANYFWQISLVDKNHVLFYLRRFEKGRQVKSYKKSNTSCWPWFEINVTSLTPVWRIQLERKKWSEIKRIKSIWASVFGYLAPDQLIWTFWLWKWNTTLTILLINEMKLEINDFE